ncbi:FAD/NAD(P)-binding oxidoreductase [Rhodovulum sp. BSW8]|uniref:NAD(P)/FAD-dependent oxidoreductase n=1 Tax=Rhodovulum sp. BSW8 TaxID=2259645 RepID=UPI000DE415ED|nr:FAD/NAD(P)-binding oxidoreductase [Rhodovulum sp. BSW8]RBO51290.1 FAD/NAD(P)-binding oxidoreductase [Rhodovulum sp. BSW8]
MTRVVIVGAGPAGIRAAETLAQAGLCPVVIDEAPRAGGQIYRRPPEGFTRPPTSLYGSEAAKAVALHGCFDGLVAQGRIDHRPESSVVAIRDGVLHVLGPDGLLPCPFDRLILATGATDRLAPVPGWQAPGVFSLGAAQIALKAQGVALGRRIVLAGSGPLLTLVAAQLQAAGAGVAAVLDTAPLGAQARALPLLAARPVVTLRGLAMRARLGRLYRAGVTLERIEADGDGPTALYWRDARGRARETPCDAVALGWHLRSETHLAELAGARLVHDPLWSQWRPGADPMGRAGAGLYLAGDGLCLLGADGAEIAGRLAAIACLQDLGLPHPAPDLRRLRRLHRFATGLARAFPYPAAGVAALPDSAVICRCEGITAGALRESAAHGGAEANRVKSLSRGGMGRCQGRYCQIAVTEILAAATGIAPAEAGRMRAQAPARPLPVSACLADPAPSQTILPSGPR